MELNPYLLAILFGLFAGFAAIFITLLIEKFGGIIGGTLGYLIQMKWFFNVERTSPTTIVPASIGIILQSDYENFANAMYTVPLGMVSPSKIVLKIQVANTGFLYCWKKIPPYLPQHYSLKTRLTLMVIVSFNLTSQFAPSLFRSLFAFGHLLRFSL
jgi:uncharacterized membrane protein YeaQ/YmgE (transglycosylase-associated protein family)